MTSQNAITLTFAAFGLAALFNFLRLVWKRQWTWAGLLIALGCFAASIIHVSIPFAMLAVPDYALNPSETTPIIWHYGVSYFLLSSALVAIFQAGVVAAMTAPKRWSAACLCVGSSWMLVTAVASFVAHWIETGRLATLSLNGDLPVWIGFPLLVMFIVAPFAYAIPWSLLRHPRKSDDGASTILAQQWMATTMAGLVLVVIVASFILGVSQSEARLVPRVARIETAFAFAVTVIIAAMAWLIFAMYRAYLKPAADIIDSIKNDRALDDIVRPGSAWHSLVHSIDQNRTKAEEYRVGLENARAQLVGFFDHVPCAMSLHRLDGTAILASQNTSLSYGLTPEQLSNRSLAELSRFWPEFDRLAETARSVATSGQPRRLVSPFRADGETEPRMYDVSMFPILDAEGRVVQLGSLGIDVTEQIAAQAETAKVQKTLQAFFDNIPAMTFIISRDRKYVSVNSYASEVGGMTFLSPENLVGKPDIANTPEHWHPVIAEAHRIVLEEGRAVTNDPSIDLPQGSYDLSVSRFPIRNADGEVEFVGGLLFDRTAEKQAARQVAASQEALHQSEKLAALGQLLAGVAHELNNPLTVLVGRSAILAEKLKGTPHERAIADLREAADRSNRIVRTFLAMARQEAPRRRKVQINDALEAAFDMVAYGMRSAGISVERAIDPTLSEVSADEDQLVQIFTNLLINAQHAVEDHDGPRTLRMTTRMDGDMIVAEIADSGPGVPPEIASRIFEPFFTTKDVGQGTGMGLAMARGMVEEHGGTLTHAPSALGGAQFAIRLPAGEWADGEPGVGPQAETATPPAARALVVDDEVSIRSMLVELLEADGFVCAEAGDGTEALDLLAAQPFDLIFSDIRMPGMDGIRFRALVADAYPHMLDRLAFMSGDVLQRDAARYASLAGHVIIDKPFNPSEIRQLVSDLLGTTGDRS